MTYAGNIMTCAISGSSVNITRENFTTQFVEYVTVGEHEVLLQKEQK